MKNISWDNKLGLHHFDKDINQYFAMKYDVPVRQYRAHNAQFYLRNMPERNLEAIFVIIVRGISRAEMQYQTFMTWWYYQMETFFAILAQSLGWWFEMPLWRHCHAYILHLNITPHHPTTLTPYCHGNIVTISLKIEITMWSVTTKST